MSMTRSDSAVFAQRKDTCSPVQRVVLVTTLTFGTGRLFRTRKICHCAVHARETGNLEVSNAGLCYELLKHLFVC